MAEVDELVKSHPRRELDEMAAVSGLDPRDYLDKRSIAEVIVVIRQGKPGKKAEVKKPLKKHLKPKTVEKMGQVKGG